MVDYETLMHEHDALVALSRQLIEVLRSERARPAEAVDCRDALSALMSSHLAKEDSAIYPQLIAGSDTAAATAARDTVTEFSDLTNDWMANLAQWDGVAIAADWNGFREQTIAIVERLLGRIRRENDLLYPLALRAAHIPLRARSAG